MIQWITDSLGTAAWGDVSNMADVQTVDVRDMVDKRGNTAVIVGAKIKEALDYLQNGKKTVICCDYGISRSNSIAAGVLAEFEGIDLSEAIQRVVTKCGQDGVKVEVISSVRKALAATRVVPASLDPAKRTILVTGGSGFVASAVIHELEKKYVVLAPRREEIDLLRDAVKLDLLVADNRVDTILHLANPRIYTVNSAMGTTLTMLKNVLDVSTEHKIHLIYLSGWEIYSGYRSKHLLADEALPPLPGGTYGESKWLCESLIRHFAVSCGLRHTILRSSPVYGLGSDRPKFIWNFLNKARENKPITTHEYQNGFPKLDLLHSDDLASAIATAINSRAEGEFNIGTGVLTSTRDVARLIVEEEQSTSDINHISIEGYASNIAMDVRKSQNCLSWHPRVEFKDGLRALLEADRQSQLGPTK